MITELFGVRALLDAESDMEVVGRRGRSRCCVRDDLKPACWWSTSRCQAERYCRQNGRSSTIRAGCCFSACRTGHTCCARLGGRRGIIERCHRAGAGACAPSVGPAVFSPSFRHAAADYMRHLNSASRKTLSPADRPGRNSSCSLGGRTEVAALLDVGLYHRNAPRTSSELS
jgi:hypothetical protein